jgi:hypothetical protein
MVGVEDPPYINRGGDTAQRLGARHPESCPMHAIARNSRPKVGLPNHGINNGIRRRPYDMKMHLILVPCGETKNPKTK